MEIIKGLVLFLSVIAAEISFFGTGRALPFPEENTAKPEEVKVVQSIQNVTNTVVIDKSSTTANATSTATNKDADITTETLTTSNCSSENSCTSQIVNATTPTSASDEATTVLTTQSTTQSTTVSAKPTNVETTSNSESAATTTTLNVIKNLMNVANNAGLTEKSIDPHVPETEKDDFLAERALPKSLLEQSVKSVQNVMNVFTQAATPTVQNALKADPSANYDLEARALGNPKETTVPVSVENIQTSAGSESTTATTPAALNVQNVQNLEKVEASSPASTSVSDKAAVSPADSGSPQNNQTSVEPNNSAKNANANEELLKQLSIFSENLAAQQNANKHNSPGNNGGMLNVQDNLQHRSLEQDEKGLSNVQKLPNNQMSQQELLNLLDYLNKANNQRSNHMRTEVGNYPQHVSPRPSMFQALNVANDMVGDVRHENFNILQRSMGKMENLLSKQSFPFLFR